MDMYHYAFTDCSLQPGNFKILPHCLKEYGFKIFNLEFASKSHTLEKLDHTNTWLQIFPSNLQCTAHHKRILTYTTYKQPPHSLRVYVHLPGTKPLERFPTYTTSKQGTTLAQWLRCCATNRKVAGSIPAGFNGIFHRHKFLPIAL